MKKVITLVMTILITLMLTGCSERVVNATQTPRWEELNATSEDTHVYFAYSDNSFYSDGSILGELLYQDFDERHRNE